MTRGYTTCSICGESIANKNKLDHMRIHETHNEEEEITETITTEPIVEDITTDTTIRASETTVEDTYQLDIKPVSSDSDDDSDEENAQNAPTPAPTAPTPAPSAPDREEIIKFMRMFHCNRNNCVFLYDYNKHDGQHETDNGTGIALNVCGSKYAIIDIDFKDSASEADRESIRKDLLNIDGTSIVSTTSGGFHMYCKYDGTWDDKPKNRFVKEYKCQHYDIDIFTPIPVKNRKDGGRSLVVLPPTLARNHAGEIRQYTLAKECADDSLSSFTDLLKTVLSRAHAKIVEEKPVPSKPKSASSPARQVHQPQADKPNRDSSPITKELFDILIAGFDSNITVHNYCSEDVGVEIALYPLIKSINACECNEISREDIEEAFDKIHENATFTKKATANWDSAVRKLRKEKNDSWTALLKMIKHHNEVYFNKHVRPLISAKESFVDGDFTIDDYRRHASMYKTRYQHLNALARCIAGTTHNDYIVKEYSGENIIYKLIPHVQIHKSVLNFMIEYEASEADKNSMRDSKKKISDTVTMKASKILNYVHMLDDFKQYSGMSLRPSSRELWSYRPPLKTDYNPTLIREWIDFMRSRVVNDKPLMEELYSHAFRLRNPSTFIEKFFIHRGPGSAGKSFFAGGLAQLYPGLANIAVKTDQVTKDMFNSWISETLMVHFEEADTDNYRNREFETFVKRITSPAGSSRGMYQTTKAVENTAIVGMNSNDPTLFGLIRADEATISRLVIIEFKERDFPILKWEEYKQRFYGNPAFSYSLYHYLKNDIEIPADFCVSRYISPEKEEFIKAARGQARNSVELWIETVVDDYARGSSKLAFKKHFRIGDYVYMQASNADTAYRQYVEANRPKYPVQRDGLKNALISLGFEFKPSIKVGGHVFNAYIIKEETFIQLSQTASSEVDEDFICDDDMDDDEMTCEQRMSQLLN